MVECLLGLGSNTAVVDDAGEFREVSRGPGPISWRGVKHGLMPSRAATGLFHQDKQARKPCDKTS